MEIDVGAYISELLYQNEKVSIPGLGGFVANYKSAEIDHVQGKIAPPSKDLSFNSNLVVNDGLLINFIKDKHSLSYAEAQKAVEDYVGRVKEAVERREIIVFPQVGRLYKDYEQKLQFLPDNTNFETNSYGLPTVSFYPVSKTPPPAAKASQPKKSGLNALSTPVISQKISQWFQRSLPFIIVLSVIIIGTGLYFVLSNSRSQKGNIEVSRVPESRVNISPTQEDTDGEDTAANTPDDEEAASAPAQEDSGMIEVTADEDLDTESATPAPDQKFCIIAIGVFGNQNNVKKLVQEIYEEGFEPYTEKRGNLTKVGVQMAYDDDSELKAALRTVQEKFSEDAKIIKK